MRATEAAKQTQISILIVSSDGKTTAFFMPILRTERFSQIAAAGGADEARRLMAGHPYDIVIINTPLPDDFGLRLAVDLVRYESTAVLLFVKSEVYEQVQQKTKDYGIIVLTKPYERYDATELINLLFAVNMRLRAAGRRAVSLMSRMEDIRIINRAKLILIERLKMSEAEAHRYVEKSAMDRCIKRREVAESIIKTYEY